jgi:hypothetical protein
MGSLPIVQQADDLGLRKRSVRRIPESRLKGVYRLRRANGRQSVQRAAIEAATGERDLQSPRACVRDPFRGPRFPLRRMFLRRPFLR